MQAEVYMFVGKRPAGVGAEAATILCAVVGAPSVRPRGCTAAAGSQGGNVFAGEDPVAEAAEHAEDFVVSEAGLENQLGDNVGRRVKGIAGSRSTRGDAGGAGCASCNPRIIESPARPSRADQKVRGVVVRGHRGLRIFQRSREPDFVAEILSHARPVLPRPTEAHRILRIDRHGKRFAAIVHAVLGFRDQTPHLTAGEAPAIIERGLAEGLALAKRIAVALIVVGGYARR